MKLIVVLFFFKYFHLDWVWFETVTLASNGNIKEIYLIFGKTEVLVK